MKNRLFVLVGLFLGLMMSIEDVSWALSSLLDLKGTTSASTGFVALLENPRDSGRLRVNADMFIKPYFSIGESTPVLPDPSKSWQTMQTRLWLDVPHSLTTRLFLQSGLGLLQGDPGLPTQSVWAPPALLVPFGVGLDYPMESGRSLTTMFSLNVTDLQVGAQSNSHLTPGLAVGIRF